MPRSVFSEAYGEVVKTLVDLRHQAGVSQVELARRIGRPQQFVSFVERSERRIDVVEFCAIVRALGHEPSVVFTEMEKRFPADLKI